jgi:hypothetical protein
MDPRIFESLLRLMTDAMQGAAGAQKTIQSLAEFPTNPSEIVPWVQKNLPNVGDLSKSQLMGDQFDAWFRMMGFVPRTRYLELLERYEDLRLRLEEADKTKTRLKSLIDPGHAANVVLDAWGNTLNKTLKTQSEWLERFLATSEEDSGAEEEAEGDADDDIEEEWESDELEDHEEKS